MSIFLSWNSLSFATQKTYTTNTKIYFLLYTLMHILFGKILKYFLWFSFAVILGSFLYWFAKFGFQLGPYINYLNGIDAQQLLEFGTTLQTWVTQTGSVLSGDLNTGENELYDPNTEADIFGQTGTVQSGTVGTTETFGFVENSENTWKSIATTPSQTSPQTVTSSGDARAQLLNLIKSKEK